jgi:hypothetical protein
MVFGRGSGETYHGSKQGSVDGREVGFSMIRGAIFAVVLVAVAGCATKAPVQEMAAARSAIETAKALPADGKKADEALKSAEEALKEAADAIEHQRFEHARRKALEAQRKAQRAATLKQAHPSSK